MNSSNAIEHQGIIENIKDNVITVSLTQHSACSACHAKGVCSAYDSKNKSVEVTNTNANYKIGDSVNVILEESLGLKALFLGYLLPFLILIASLVIASNLVDNEVIVGLTAISLLIPYYLTLYFNRNKIKNTFTFKIK